MKWDNALVLEVKEYIEREIYHPFLVENIDPPTFDEQKLRLVLSILTAQNLPKKLVTKYATVVMLVQMALDTHDLFHGKGESRQKKQLRVLAGDFYSGLYYRMLSFIPNIQLIKDLADGIKIVNEKKLQLYNKEAPTIQDLMGQIQAIETVIFQKLAAFFQDRRWESISKDWLHYQHIKRNREKYIDYILTYFMDEEDLSNDTKTSVTIDQWFQRYEQDVFERLKRSFQGVPDPFNLMGIDSRLDEQVKQSFI